MTGIADDAEQLRTALEQSLPNAFTLTQSHRDDLRVKVCAFVDLRASAGVQPEHIIAEIRQIARRVSASAFTDDLLGEIVQWCLVHYYRDRAENG